MQKGSLVRVKTERAIVRMYISHTMRRTPFPIPGREYILATDITDYICEHCAEVHKVVQLEEIPGELFIPEIFEELQSPEEVNIEQIMRG